MVCSRWFLIPDLHLMFCFRISFNYRRPGNDYFYFFFFWPRGEGGDGEATHPNRIEKEEEEEEKRERKANRTKPERTKETKPCRRRGVRWFDRRASTCCWAWRRRPWAGCGCRSRWTSPRPKTGSSRTQTPGTCPPGSRPCAADPHTWPQFNNNNSNKNKWRNIFSNLEESNQTLSTSNENPIEPSATRSIPL